MLNILILLVLINHHFNSDYRIDIGKYYNIEKHNQPNGYVEALTVLDNEGIQQFIISIPNIVMSNIQSPPNVYGAEYKQALLSKCGCSIENTTKKNTSILRRNNLRYYETVK